MTTDQPPQLLLTRRDAARMLSICEKHLAGLPIPIVRCGRRAIRYDVRDLREFIESHKASADSTRE